MILFAIALLCLGGMVALISVVLTASLAWPKDSRWGLASDWREARVPFCVGLASVGLMATALLNLPEGTLTAPFKSAVVSVQESKAKDRALNEESMSAVRLDAERQLQLLNLKRREAALLARKAELAPSDEAGAETLSDEIRKYNSELQPILAQRR